jgi:hypothetical protein
LSQLIGRAVGRPAALSSVPGSARGTVSRRVTVCLRADAGSGLVEVVQKVTVGVVHGESPYGIANGSVEQRRATAQHFVRDRGEPQVDTAAIVRRATRGDQAAVLQSGHETTRCGLAQSRLRCEIAQVKRPYGGGRPRMEDAQGVELAAAQAQLPLETSFDAGLDPAVQPVEPVPPLDQ